MPSLGSEVRHIIHVTEVATGLPKTGLADADFTKTLRRRSGSTLVSDSATVTVSQIDAALLPGAYWVLYTPATAAVLHELIVTTVSSAYTIEDGIYEDEISGAAAVAGPYLSTLANVKLALDIDGTADDERINALLASVTVWAESYCDRKFVSASRTEYLNGHDHAVLNLPSPPVTALTSVHVSTTWPRAYGSAELLVNGTEYLLTQNQNTAQLWRAGGTWPDGPETVKVIYTSGYTTIPADLERAAIEIITVKLQRGKHQSYHVAGENRGDGSVTYSPAIALHDIPIHAKQVLDQYRERGRLAA